MVRYLGTDPTVAESARRELARIQHEARTERNLRRLVRKARAALREAKTRSAPALKAAGLVYHGYQIRRRKIAGGGLHPVSDGGSPS